MVADPEAKHNHNEVVAEGDFGIIRFEIDNAPITMPVRGAKFVAMNIAELLCDCSFNIRNSS